MPGSEASVWLRSRFPPPDHDTSLIFKWSRQNFPKLDSNVEHVADGDAVAHLSVGDNGTPVNLNVSPAVDRLRRAHAHAAFGNIPNPNLPVIRRLRIENLEDGGIIGRNTV